MRPVCLALAASTLALAGCAIAPTPRPEGAAVHAPAGWLTQVGNWQEIDQQWWTLFGDPRLSGLVEAARAHNPDIGIAMARIREARGAERAARAQLLPSLNLGVGGGRQRTVSAFGTPSESWVAEPQAVASYEVDLFGRGDDQIAASRAGTMAAEAAAEATRLTVSAATARSYVTLRALDARYQLVRATLDARAEALRIARSRARVGYTSNLELRQAEAEYEGTAQLLPSLSLAIEQQEHALSTLTGVAPGGITRGQDFDAMALPPVPMVMPSALLQRRPDIAQAEWSLVAADSSLSASRKLLLPQIQLQASGGAAISSLLSNPIGVFSLGGSILAPIFEGGKIRGGIEASAGKRDQAAFGYQKTVLQAFREVEDNLSACRRIDEQYQSLSRQRTAVADSLRIAQRRYDAGYTSYLEQIDAQRALLSVEQSLIQTRLDRFDSVIGLYQAMGGGWDREQRKI